MYTEVSFATQIYEFLFKSFSGLILFATNWESGSDIMYFRALLDEGNGAEILPKVSDSGM